MRKKSSRATANGNGTGANGDGTAAESAPGTPAQSSNVVDLNTASVEELRQLRGIGRALAERIIEYRTSNGPFASPADVLRVPGISQVAYDAISSLVIASAPTPHSPGPTGASTELAADAVEAPAPQDEPAPSAQQSENGAAVAAIAPESRMLAVTEIAAQAAQSTKPDAVPELPKQETPAPRARVPEPPEADITDLPVLSNPAPTKPAPIEPAIVVVPARTAGPAPDPAPMPPPRAAAVLLPPVPTPAPAQVAAPVSAPVARAPAAPLARPARDWTGLMAMCVLSAVLGAILALLALAGLNRGTLLLNERPEIVALTNQLDQERNRANALQTEADSLRTRLDALHGLSNQVAALESSMSQAKSALDSLQSQTTALDQRTSAVESQLTVVRAAVDRFDGFLSGLRALVEAAAPTPTNTPTLAPSSTPTLPPSATATARPSDTPVLTWTAAPSQTQDFTQTTAANTPTPAASSTEPATATSLATSTTTTKSNATPSHTPTAAHTPVK